MLTDLIQICLPSEFLFPYNFIELRNKSVFIIQTPLYATDIIRVGFNVSPFSNQYTLPILDTKQNQLAFPQIKSLEPTNRLWVNTNQVLEVFFQQMVHSLKAYDINYLPYHGLYYNEVPIDKPIIKIAEEQGIILPSNRLFQGIPLNISYTVEGLRKFFSEYLQDNTGTFLSLFVRHYYIKTQLKPGEIIKILNHIYKYLEDTGAFYIPDQYTDKCGDIIGDESLKYFLTTWMKDTPV